MSTVVSVAIHSSQSPDRVLADLAESLRRREVHHKFHYESHKQSRKWLALHQAYSPSRIDPDCTAIYDRGFDAVAERIGSAGVDLIGLGCGGGQKDCRLIQRLCQQSKRVSYIPSDVSVPLVLIAQKGASSLIDETAIHPLVGDFGTATDFDRVLDGMTASGGSRVLTFFGMIPNFEPGVILPKLAQWVHKGDWLLFSANLAPGPDYAAGVQTVLPGYDNSLTRDWLMTFLTDLGVGDSDGALRFSIEEGDAGLRRIVARFEFANAVSLGLDDEAFEFHPGDSIRLFYSYRYTPGRAVALLRQYGFTVSGQWITPSGEEGVFLCQKL